MADLTTTLQFCYSDASASFENQCSQILTSFRENSSDSNLRDILCNIYCSGCDLRKQTL